MSIVEYFDHPFRKQDKEHFKHLVQVALADGIIEDSEVKMLYQLGRNMGLTGAEMDELLEIEKRSEYNPPYKLARRFKQLYGIVKMILADGNISNDEMRLTHKLALTSGFPEIEVPILLTFLIEGIRDGEEEENLFILYKERRKSL
jgi:hypothetical protein